MKKLIAILAVLGTFVFAPAAFAQNHHQNGGVNLRVSPNHVPSFNHGFDNRGGDHRFVENRGRDRDGDNRGYDNRRFDHDYDRGYNRGYDRDYYRDNYRYRGPSIIIRTPGFYYGPSYQSPYYYFDRFGREIYVDSYGRARYTGYTRGCDYDDDCY